MRFKDRQDGPRGSAVIARGRRVRDLLKNWKAVEAKIRSAGKIALFLDFDGTLAPIAAMPEEAAIPKVTRHELERLVGNSRMHVAVISGRRREDLMRRAGLDGPIYLGLYGWEREANQPAPAAVTGTIRSAYDLLRPEFDAIPRVWIENKTLSLAIHFMDASMWDRRRAQGRILAALHSLLRKELRIERNLRDWEILPQACGDKGVGVEREIARNGTRDALPIYIGDDVSDEAAFRALKHGITVCVGRRAGTHAEYFVESPAEVGAILHRTAEALQ